MSGLAEQKPAGQISLGDEYVVKQLLTGTFFDLWRIVNRLTKAVADQA